MINIIKNSTILTIRLFFRALLGRKKRDALLNSVGFDIGHSDSYWIITVSKDLKSRFLLSVLNHEKEIMNEISKIDGSVFIDIGANIGIFPILLTKKFRTIIAIEPEPSNYKILVSNTTALANNITCMEVAISNSNSIMKFFLSGSLTHSLIQDNTIQEFIEVETMTLESLLSKMNIESVDIVKVDVEGAEWMVLEGAKNIMGQIRNWVIELHDWSREQEMTELLESYGYSCKWVGERKHIIAQTLRARRIHLATART